MASVHQKHPVAKVAISAAGSVGLGWPVLSSMTIFLDGLESDWLQALIPIKSKPIKNGVLFISGVKFRVLCRF